jgi:Na+/H+-dicarboxylate symporter
MRVKAKLTTWIFIAMILGILVGYMCHQLLPSPEAAKTTAGYISLFTDIFLRLIKMIIAPLVFSTLVVGIAHMGDTKAIGRIGLKTMGWFVTASLMSLVLGMVMVNLLRPGDGLNLPLPDASASANLKGASLSFRDFVTHLVPKSVVEAMANNEILQIVVFSAFLARARRRWEKRRTRFWSGSISSRSSCSRSPVTSWRWRRLPCSPPWPRW